jgi:hypothetical protein
MNTILISTLKAKAEFFPETLATLPASTWSRGPKSRIVVEEETNTQGRSSTSINGLIKDAISSAIYVVSNIVMISE